MKKVFSVLVMSGLLLTACSNEEAAKEEEPEKELTKEEITEVIHDLEEEAKKEGLVKSIEVKEEEKEVLFFVDFEENADEQDRANFLFNYLLFLEQKYPEKEVTFKEQE